MQACVEISTKHQLGTNTVDADLVFEINDQGHVRERSLSSRDASPSYTPNPPRQSQPRSIEEVVEADATGEFDDDEPPVDPVSHLSLPTNSYISSHIGGGGHLRDFSLYQFFYLGPAGKFVTWLFLNTVFTAAVAELLHGEIKTHMAYNSF